MIGRPRSPYLLVVLAFALLVAGAWVGRDRIRPVGVGSDAPDFTLPTLEGEEVSLEEYRGRPVLVNVWATWCLPCRWEMPAMQRLYQEFEAEGFEILAVSVDRPGFSGEDRSGEALRRGIRAFADSLGVTFPILHDPTGAIERSYRTTGLPESFLVGPDGTIYKKVAGATEWDAPEHRELVRRLLGPGDGRSGAESEDGERDERDRTAGSSD